MFQKAGINHKVKRTTFCYRCKKPIFKNTVAYVAVERGYYLYLKLVHANCKNKNDDTNAEHWNKKEPIFAT